MGRRTFDVVDLTELFVHWEAGRSQVQISESLGLSAAQMSDLTEYLKSL